MTASEAIDRDPSDAYAEPPPLPAAAVPAPPPLKNPWLAGVLSFFPGIGNVYNGLYLRGLTFFLIIAGLIKLANVSDELFGFAVAFFWIFNVLDAYRQATLINLGYTSDLGLADTPQHPRHGQGTAAAGAILFVIGLVAMLERYFVFDLEWIVDLWPFGFMVLGAWLFGLAVKARRRPAPAVTEETLG